jgi:hypothetical protein
MGTSESHDRGPGVPGALPPGLPDVHTFHKTRKTVTASPRFLSDLRTRSVRDHLHTKPLLQWSKTRRYLSPLPFNFALEFASRKI